MKKILIVEDDKVLNDAFKMFLSRLGEYEICQAYSREEGLLQAKTQALDVVMLDYDLGNGNSGDIARYFASCENKPKIFVISGKEENYKTLKNIIDCEYAPKPNSHRIVLEYLKDGKCKRCSYDEGQIIDGYCRQCRMDMGLETEYEG